MGLGLQVMIYDRHSTIACNCSSVCSFLEVRIVFAFVVCDLCNFEMLDRWIQDSIVVFQELGTWIFYIGANESPSMHFHARFICTWDYMLLAYSFYWSLSRSSRNKS